jgi:hypothetical protein
MFTVDFKSFPSKLFTVKLSTALSMQRYLADAFDWSIDLARRVDAVVAIARDGFASGCDFFADVLEIGEGFVCLAPGNPEDNGDRTGVRSGRYASS